MIPFCGIQSPVKHTILGLVVNKPYLNNTQSHKLHGSGPMQAFYEQESLEEAEQMTQNTTDALAACEVT